MAACSRVMECTLFLCLCFAGLSLCVRAFNKNDIYMKPIPPGMQRDRSKTDGLRGQEPYTNSTIDEIILKSMGGIWNAAGILFRGNKIQSELDMVLPRGRFFRLYGLSSRLQGARRKKRKSLRGGSLRWPGAVIPFKIVPGNYDDRELFWLNRSMTEWERYTCVRFKPAATEDQNYVKFRSGDGCYTDVGMAGGEQVVNLERPTCRWKAVYLHMLGHVIGLVHEHQVPNRDQFLTVELNNVDPSWRMWLKKYDKSSLNRFKIGYDPASIMHYGETAYSIDGHSLTMTLKNNSRSITLGKVWRRELSFKNAKLVNLMYKCGGKCPKELKCSGGGFVTENCECLCQDGTSDCQACVNSLASDWNCFVWANQGECQRNRDWMETRCAKACGFCSEDKKKTVKKRPNLGAIGLALRVWRHRWETEDEDSCKDVVSTLKCAEWSNRGECLTNIKWMKWNCHKSCKLCSSVTDSKIRCINDHLDDGECDHWAREGECMINKLWMTANCRKACQACTPADQVSFERTKWESTDITCTDKAGRAACLRWQKRGECEENDRWMTYNCRQTCHRCDDGGCKNLYSDYDCEKWKTEMEECTKRPAWMRKFCKLSCGHCKPGKGETTPIPYRPGKSETDAKTTRTTTTQTTTEGPCRDAYQTASCQRWATSDHCRINPSWMSKNCRKSCGICVDVVTVSNTGACYDIAPDCPVWARGGYCHINPALMLRSCRKSCNSCVGVCEDRNPMCPMWGRSGYCQATPGPMSVHCQKTCGVC